MEDFEVKNEGLKESEETESTSAPEEDIQNQDNALTEQEQETETSPVSEAEPVKEKKKMNAVIEWAIIIAIALAAALFINYVIIINSVVPSGSMETTIMTNSRMMGLRVTYWFSDPQRGDIVVFKYPDDPSENFVKRVIGTPGDVVEIIDGITYVNGEVLDEPYLKEPPIPRSFGPFEVPEGHYFMMGDNRNNSNDSRFWKNTYVPRNYVLGKALFVYWPFNRMGVLK